MLIQQIGGQLQGIILPSPIDEAAAQAIQEKLSKRMEDFTQEANAALEKAPIGGLVLQLMITQTGLGMALTYKGQPVDPTIFAQLQEKGEIDKSLTWDAVLSQAQEAAKAHIGKFKEVVHAEEIAYVHLTGLSSEEKRAGNREFLIVAR